MAIRLATMWQLWTDGGVYCGCWCDILATINVLKGVEHCRTAPVKLTLARCIVPPPRLSVGLPLVLSSSWTCIAGICNQ
jgi:hypothetical protein